MDMKKREEKLIYGAYESDPGFIEARILEYCVNEAKISLEKAEELIAYVRMLGKALPEETITNRKPVKSEAEETKKEKEEPEVVDQCIRIEKPGRKFQSEAAILKGTCGVLLAGCAVCMVLLGRKK